MGIIAGFAFGQWQTRTGVAATTAPAIAAQASAPSLPTASPTPPVDINNVKVAGEPFIGSTNAPLTIAYWYDYQCPLCRQNELSVMPQLVKEYVDTGKVRIVFKSFQFIGADSKTLGRVAQAVWDTAPKKFYLWHEAVYENQGTENTGWATPEKIRSITQSVLGTETTNTVLALAKTKADVYQKQLDANESEASALGVNGTPTILIGTHLITGAQPFSVYKTAIDAALGN